MKPLLREAAKRYQKAGTKKGKSAILDELVGYTKMNPRPRPGQRREDEGGAENRRLETTEGRRQEADLLGRVRRRPAGHLGVFLVPVRKDTRPPDCVKSRKVAINVIQ